MPVSVSGPTCCGGSSSGRQYKYYVIFQSKDENQEINEWKAGFTVFF